MTTIYSARVSKGSRTIIQVQELNKLRTVYQKRFSLAKRACSQGFIRQATAIRLHGEPIPATMTQCTKDTIGILTALQVAALTVPEILKEACLFKILTVMARR